MPNIGLSGVKIMPRGVIYFLGLVVVIMVVVGFLGVGQWP
jgi:hypothetical protein